MTDLDQIDADARYINALERKVITLRVALKKLADENNWFNNGDIPVWFGETKPREIAQDALDATQP